MIFFIVLAGLMAFHKKFTFDDPEDSYWNENGQRANLFDDIDSRQVAARAAMDNLFESDSPARPVQRIADLSPSVVTRPTIHGGQPIEVDRRSSDGASSTNTCNEPPTPTRDDERRAASEHPSPTHPSPSSRGLGLGTTTLNKLTPGRMSSPSIVSEGSVSSLPSEANKLDLDFNRLRAEHRKLLRHLETVRTERYRALDVNETVKRLLMGEPVSLDLYKSREDKLRLLDAAVAVVDHHVILAVLLFLKSTLSDTLFRDLLMKRSEAAEVYVEHLKESRDVSELSSTLFALGRNEDAAMVELAAASRIRAAPARAAALRRCLASSFSDPQLAAEAGLVADGVNLLERQIVIEEADKKVASTHQGMKQFPPRAALPTQSAIATLYYSCLYHYDRPPADPCNPQSLCQLLRLSEREFVWTAVSALVRQSRWPDVERALQTKGLVKAFHSRGILGGVGASTKLSCPFSWRTLFRVLHSNGTSPPKDLLTRILRSVADEPERLALAQKAKVSEIVIESLVGSREREKLAAYTATLTPNTPDSFKALAALNNPSIKWKT